MKGIIVAAGYGTRFLPVTKTIPKEMLPLINKPSISFIIEEFIQSGIKDIIIISSRRKKVLEDFFDREIELESVFKKEGATAKLESITPGDARFAFIRQMEMMGTGHALLQAAPLIGDEPVVVAYPDDIHMGDKPLSAQLIDCYKETGCSVLATIHNPPNLERYGVLDLAEDKLHVKGMIEKPPDWTGAQQRSLHRALPLYTRVLQVSGRRLGKTYRRRILPSLRTAKTDGSGQSYL